ncbi:peregrin [Cimex lectularius]|uniref:Peregrin n=1 Tax=Cimex lectularius TaxID=79782 RepID=A0A8I6SJZ6_CIMLE|nr:peregrin [Cimex lectularius]
MSLDFDVLEYCRKLRTTKQPPYTCPVAECAKSYKSICGFQYHLVNFDHNSLKSGDGQGSPAKPLPGHTPGRKAKKRKRWTKAPETPKTPKLLPPAPREKMSYSESQRFVEFEIDDEVFRVAMDAPIPIISKHNYEVKYGTIGNYNLDLSKSKDSVLKLPEPKFSIIDDYGELEPFEKPSGYIRFIERSAEDLDEEVEYDMDEEDSVWLDIINDRREESGFPPVSVEAFELLMDRLEKESYFQMKTSNKPDEVGTMIDDDAVCCICMDGECQNSNVILFCDMCNLAVHQDCYGVPYIPEGQWLCRRCLQSPSRAVDCVLCPNNGGAFKQTDRGHWAHVVCALWIPEVRFANTVFLEPIDSIETIPPARWKLTCYLCKQRGVGACIQCHRTNCYLAFHVTCAQQSGLYMKIDAVKDSITGNEQVQNIAYCTTHTPPDAEKPKIPVATSPKVKKTTTAPVISIPTIPPERIQEIGTLINVPKKNQFIQRLIAYWTLKRQLRNGVPLLRRLQTTHMSKKGDAQAAAKGSNDVEELRKQLKYWQRLRQDLERARLLCELVRKREKLKKELVKVKSLCLEMELCPLMSFLRRLLDMIRARDTGEIFIEPVDQTEVPDYSDVVKNPMDLSTMRNKIEAFEYSSLQEFQADFHLMINNCLAYNSKDTIFYRAALKMLDQGGALLKQAQQDLDLLGLNTGCLSPSYSDVLQDDNSSKDCDFENKKNDSLHTSDIDTKLVNLTKEQNTMAKKDLLKKLNDLLELTKNIKPGQARKKRIKLIKTLLAKVKRTKKPNEGKDKEKKGKEDLFTPEITTHLERRSRRKEISPVKDENQSESTVSSSSSPTGINRRTAVLFTRKAAAASKVNPDPPSRRRGRPSKNVETPKSDSFSTYRSSELNVKSDEESRSEGSSCSECDSTASRSGSSSDSDSEWSDSVASSPENTSMEALDQLQLVWAKCRGYPWYPALIINPKMPKGYVHNGVPIPSPPADVIALANNYTEPVYLVLFFDAKRTWQWLPRNKLEPLGITQELDHIKLTESRKPADRKAVRKAYQEAMLHRTQIDKPSNEK